MKNIICSFKINESVYDIVTNDSFDRCYIEKNGQFEYEETSFKNGIYGMFDYIETLINEGTNVTLINDESTYTNDEIKDMLNENDNMFLSIALG